MLDEPRYNRCGHPRSDDHRPRAARPRRVAQADRGRTAVRSAAASSRTTPTSPRGCWPCTRPRSTNAVQRGAGPRRPDPRPVLRSGGWLRHRKRSRAPDHLTQGPAGQRGSVRWRDGHHRAVAGGVDREGRYREAVERALGTVAPFLARYPTGFAQWLVAASFAASMRSRSSSSPAPRAPTAWRPATFAGLVDLATSAGARRRPAGSRGRLGRPAASSCR